MDETSTPELTKWQTHIVWTLVGVWVLSKVYRLSLLHEFGLFSWELWRVDLGLAGALVLLGVVAFRIAARYEHPDSSGKGDKPRAGSA